MADSLGYEYTLSETTGDEVATSDRTAAAPAAWLNEVQGWLKEVQLYVMPGFMPSAQKPGFMPSAPTPEFMPTAQAT